MKHQTADEEMVVAMIVMPQYKGSTANTVALNDVHFDYLLLHIALQSGK